MEPDEFSADLAQAARQVLAAAELPVENVEDAIRNAETLGATFTILKSALLAWDELYPNDDFDN